MALSEKFCVAIKWQFDEVGWWTTEFWGTQPWRQHNFYICNYLLLHAVETVEATKQCTQLGTGITVKDKTLNLLFMFYFAGSHALGCSHGSCTLEALRDCIDCAMQLTNNFTAEKKSAMIVSVPPGFVEFTTGKVVRKWCALYILTWKCFAPQRRAFFRHLNFQKCSEMCFAHFVLRGATACTFSTLLLPKVVRHWGVLYILTWKCASRHNGVQLFISHLPRCLRTRRFSEPTFRPTGATNHWKKRSVSRRSYLFAHLHLLSSDLFSSNLSHLCFSTVHIVGSFTLKLPSNIIGVLIC